MSNIKILKWQKEAFYRIFFHIFVQISGLKILQMLSFKTFLQQQQNILIVVDCLKALDSCCCVECALLPFIVIYSTQQKW